MRILFLSYWGFEDPLTTATVLPHLHVLQARPDVAAIRLVTVERGQAALCPPLLTLPFANNKISFEPLLSPPGQRVLVTKTNDFRRFPRELAEQARQFGADIILARGAPAGALAYLVQRRTGLPFYVESFEPHAEYMRKAGVWRWYDPRYIFQQYWENQQKKRAAGLMPVAESYRRQLLREGVPAERVVTVPCSVSLTDFAYDPIARTKVRQQLAWTADTVGGVYVGKFGGIYYDEEAYGLFKEVAEFFGPNFRLLLLTPQAPAEVRARLAAVDLDSVRVTITKVPFAEVPAYLSAADFAFGLHRPTPYVSPIKIGEYWASGLPVLLTEGVGDDSGIITAEGGGAVFNLARPDSVSAALASIQEQLTNPLHRVIIQRLAVRYRSVERAREAYTALLPASSRL
ncbi:glycosyltransferase [Hymenobacter psoromatis]|uniref:glycosyltransferase n=1 Tax=Hymenobacter psoromatis TaxID=1484116 RepID=UPI001CBD2964|nr:glycosyltransferase [Hymenobacter psoromatis]